MILELADEQSTVGLCHDAIMNYHTACVFFRVMEPLLPTRFLTQQQSKLIYAVEQIKKLQCDDNNNLSCSCSNDDNNCNTNQSGDMLSKNLVSGNIHDIYRVHQNKLLGSGTYGSVYLATHRLTGIQRAVKVLNIERVTSYNVRKIHNEIMLLSKLNHKNVIQLHDVFFGNKTGNHES